MKKLFALLLVCACLLSLGTAALAEGEEMVPVCVSVPETWEAPCLWAWADDGTNAFAAWPGEEADKLGDTGWYYCYVPSFVQNVIVNANAGAVQTEGVVVEAGKPVWITVAEDNTATVSYDAQTDAEIPEYVEKITVHAYVPLEWKTVNLWAWLDPDGTNAFETWPGEAMTETDGWYALEAPGWINSVIINANEGSVQTSDLTVETGKDVWVVVNGPEDAVVSYEQPTGDVAEPEATPEATPAPSEAPAETESGGNATVWIIVAVAVVAVIVIAVAVSKKKKKD